jgi:hypothetical protein
LDEILADLCSKGRPANGETAQEIIVRLEEEKNYIPASDIVRREYAFLLLREYREYLESRGGSVGEKVTNVLDNRSPRR